MTNGEVVYADVTGWPKNVVTIVLRRISAYTRTNVVRYFKVGISADPDRRFNEEHKYNYDQMIVVYRSDSYDNVCELERELVEHNKGLADNLIAGGGGRRGDPPYFMYVVIKRY